MTSYNGRHYEERGEDNLLRVYNLATDSQMDRGIRWYEYAKHWASKVADKYALPITTVVGMTAALSVNNRWAFNQRDVVYVIEQVQHGNRDPMHMNCTTYKNQVWKAMGILLSGEDPLMYINGQKEISFYQDILSPFDVNKTVVTVDIWAYRAWKFNSVAQVPTLSDSLYRLISNDYYKAANKVELLPREFQAVVWLTIRNAGRGKQCRLPMLEAQIPLL